LSGAQNFTEVCRMKGYFRASFMRIANTSLDTEQILAGWQERVSTVEDSNALCVHVGLIDEGNSRGLIGLIHWHLHRRTEEQDGLKSMLWSRFEIHTPWL